MNETTYTSLGVFTTSQFYVSGVATQAASSTTANEGKIKYVSATGTAVAYYGIWNGLSCGTTVSNDGLIQYTYTGQTLAYANSQTNELTYNLIDRFFSYSSGGNYESRSITMQDYTYSVTASSPTCDTATAAHTGIGIQSFTTFSITEPANVSSYTQESRRTTGLYSSEYRSDTTTSSTTSSTTETHTYPAVTYSEVVSKDYLESQMKLYDSVIRDRYSSFETVTINIYTGTIDWSE